MNRLHPIQESYGIAAALYDQCVKERNKAELQYLLRIGYKKPDGTDPKSPYDMGDISDEQFDAVTSAMMHDPEVSRANDNYYRAVENKTDKENKLIDWSLSLLPFPKEREVLNANRNNYTIRQKLIDLALKLDASTIPTR